jgi:hypothetical protein
MKNKERIISAAFITLIIIGLCKWCYDDVNKVEAPDAAVTEVTTTNVTTETTMGVTTSCTTSCTTEITTENTTEITTIPVTEQVTEAVNTQAEIVVNNDTPLENNQPVEEPQEEPAPVEEYLVYKPSSHYIHKNTCRWNKDDAYRVDDVTSLEARLCTECNPVCEGYVEYSEPTPNTDNMTYVGYFGRVTYYPQTHYYPGVCGGSGRTLIGYGNYDNGIRGSIASRSLYETYGYDRDGRTTVYLEFPGYDFMNGWYYLDDYCRHYGVIDVFVWSENNYDCPFYGDGVITANCYIN